MIQYVLSGNEVGILIEKKNGLYKILTDVGGDPGYIYSRSINSHIPEGPEKATLDKYYGYYQTILKNFPLSKANLVAKKVWAYPKNGRPYLTTVWRSPDNKQIDDAMYRKIIDGDENALVHLVFNLAYKNGEYSKYLKKTLGKMIDLIDVDDVIQETGMAMLNHQEIGSLSNVKQDKIVSYIGGAFLNIGLRYYKHYKRLANNPNTANKTTTGEDTEGDILLHTAISSIEKEIKESSGNNKNIKISIFRQYITGDTYDEIAKRMNMTRDTVKYHLKNINNAIRQVENKKGLNFAGSPLGNLRTILAKRQFDPSKLEKAARRLAMKYEFHGLPISIENHTANERTGVDKDGRKWSTVMNQPYGYIRGTIGADGDHVDCFIGPYQNSDQVFVIHQNNPDGSYDEDKVMLGFKDRNEARAAYLSNYDRSDMLGDITEMNMNEFKESLKNNKGKKLEKAEIRTIRMSGGKIIKAYIVGRLEKAKAMPIGTIRVRKDGSKYQKTIKGWVKASDISGHPKNQDNDKGRDVNTMETNNKYYKLSNQTIVEHYHHAVLGDRYVIVNNEGVRQSVKVDAWMIADIRNGEAEQIGKPETSIKLTTTRKININGEPMVIKLYHTYYDKEHLKKVIEEMKKRGAPIIPAIYDERYGHYIAVGGSHRLRAAKELGLTPIIKKVTIQEAQKMIEEESGDKFTEEEFERILFEVDTSGKDLLEFQKSDENSNVLEKAKAVPIGTESVHGGRRVKKTAKGWVPISPSKTDETQAKKDEAKPENKTDAQGERNKKQKVLREQIKSGIKAILDAMSQMYQGKPAGEELATRAAEKGKEIAEKRKMKKEEKKKTKVQDKKKEEEK